MGDRSGEAKDGTGERFGDPAEETTEVTSMSSESETMRAKAGEAAAEVMARDNSSSTDSGGRRLE
jgi:hypothetical protein